jgi:hypothetical protein
MSRNVFDSRAHGLWASPAAGRLPVCQARIACGLGAAGFAPKFLPTPPGQGYSRQFLKWADYRVPRQPGRQPGLAPRGRIGARPGRCAVQQVALWPASQLCGRRCDGAASSDCGRTPRHAVTRG